MHATDYKIPGATRHFHGFLMSFWGTANEIPKMSVTFFGKYIRKYICMHG